MMNKLMMSIAAVTTFGLVASAPALSAPWGGTVSNAFESQQSATVIKVHSPRRAHDMLHNYGYDRVHLVRQREDYNGKPIYVFRVCGGRKRYKIKVNWYGEIIKKRRAGWCVRRDWY